MRQEITLTVPRKVSAKENMSSTSNFRIVLVGSDGKKSPLLFPEELTSEELKSVIRDCKSVLNRFENKKHKKTSLIGS